MSLRDWVEGMEELKELGIRPRQTIARRTLYAYGTAVMAAGTFCANLYAQPAIVTPCDERPAQLDALAATASFVSVAPMSSVLVVYVSS